MRCFEGVTIGLPAGANCLRATDIGARWVMWCIGDLRIDSATRAIFCCPRGAGRPESKPLGCLLGAQVVPAEDGSGVRSFVVTTNDQIHGLIRCTFRCHEDEDVFMALARTAQVSLKQRARDSIAPGHRYSAAGDGDVASLVAGITDLHPGFWPLVYAGVELYGQDPQASDHETEVLIGRGAIVMLDPLEADRVGMYELLFYEEGSSDPSLRLPIGPRMRLQEQRDDASIGAVGTGNRRQSIASRRSSMMVRPGSCLVFDIIVAGAQTRTLAFDTEADAENFRRDFNVRQRLLSLSLKTSRGQQAYDMLQDEFYAYQEAGLLPTLWRWSKTFLFLVVVTVLYQAVVIYINAPVRPPLGAVLGEALRDASSWLWAGVTGVSEVGASICFLVTAAIPLDAAERCATLPNEVGDGAVRSCLKLLVNRAR